MKRTLLFVLALAVIPVTVDAQVTGLAQLRALAEQGDPLAQNNLGFMYANGEGVPEDDVEAVRWYRLAAEQGNALAQSNLGVMYQNGDGVIMNRDRAAILFRRACVGGLAAAC